jgi:VIT1/CCC1 family predicted Fe2+/Mn2+ transporter
LSKATILILGLSNIIADGLSMAASTYLGTKAQNDQRRLISEFESAQIDADPEGEREEIKKIFIAKGLTGHLLDEAFLLVPKNRKQWVNTTLDEEYGLASSETNPLKAGLNNFIYFLLYGLIPLIPYF